MSVSSLIYVSKNIVYVDIFPNLYKYMIYIFIL